MNTTTKLRPTLWRTCRVIASETRLQLLWLLFDQGELCVSQLVSGTGTTQPNASNQLRAISARGLITYRREGLKVIYRAAANTGVDFAPALLKELKQCHRQNMTFRKIILQATAFTHERRIEIIRILNQNRLSFDGLRNFTGMSQSALSRHLEKLEIRKFIKRRRGLYQPVRPGNPLGRTLFTIACSQSPETAGTGNR